MEVAEWRKSKVNSPKSNFGKRFRQPFYQARRFSVNACLNSIPSAVPTPNASFCNAGLLPARRAAPQPAEPACIVAPASYHSQYRACQFPEWFLSIEI
ncbi:hypothetical protein [Hymenobacter daeguensis]